MHGGVQENPLLPEAPDISAAKGLMRVGFGLGGDALSPEELAGLLWRFTEKPLLDRNPPVSRLRRVSLSNMPFYELGEQRCVALEAVLAGNYRLGVQVAGWLAAFAAGVLPPDAPSPEITPRGRQPSVATEVARLVLYVTGRDLAEFAQVQNLPKTTIAAAAQYPHSSNTPVPYGNFLTLVRTAPAWRAFQTKLADMVIQDGGIRHPGELLAEFRPVG